MDGSMFRLAKRGGDGLCCDARGVALGPVALVDAAEAKGRRVYRVRPAEEIARALALAYDAFTPDDLACRLSGLDVAARALEAGDMAKAMVVTALLKLPPLSAAAMAKLAEDPTLRKYSADQARDERGRWTSEGGEPDASGANPVQVAEVAVNNANETTGASPTTAEIGPSPIPPDYKKDFVKQKDWERFLGGLKQAGLPIDRQYIYSEIFAAEGGFEVNPKNGSVGGITRSTLNDALDAADPYIPGVKPGQRLQPKDLTPRQLVGAYDYYFDNALNTVDKDRNGSDLLTTIDDQKTAAAFADVIIRDGPHGGTRVIENAVNDVLKTLPADERQRLGVPEQIDVDSDMGPRAFNTFRALSNGGYSAQLRGAVADRRLGGTFGDERKRIEYFR